MFQLLSVLENTLSKLARYDQSSLFSSILTLTVSKDYFYYFHVVSY